MGDGIVTHRDKLEIVCEDIRICIDANYYQKDVNDEPGNYEIFLKDLQLGAVIAKGCNAVVHSARWKNTTSSERTSSRDAGMDLITAMPNTDCTNTKFNPDEIEDDPSKICKPFNGYDLAVKMMFNYEAESNAPTIMRAMYKEIVPAKRFNISEANELFTPYDNTRFKMRLPPHPNIVDMHCLFTDNVPNLPHAMSLYPDALPRRLNQNGAGRNMTLFLVMKRYHCSLQEYLLIHEPSPRTCFLLLAQLLEGVVHMKRHMVAHRDLKSDNILLDLSDGLDCPHLVITDFGCCLADRDLDLKLPYYTEEMDKGGNSALMAPEVACAKPGPYVFIDYSMADLWAVGALAYEIFGMRNPFYRTDVNCHRLDSRSYNESDLPHLPNNVHPIARRLIHNILNRNPRNRPTCTTAANVFDILLFGPKKLVSFESHVQLKDTEIIQWVLTLTARTIIQRSVIQSQQKLKRVEQELLASFLRRVELDQLEAAVGYFASE